MNGERLFLGIVQSGTFEQLMPDASGPTKFTSIEPQEARAPESGELELADYEGRAVMIRGVDQSGWIFSAEVVDQAGPILTIVVQEMFRRQRRSS